MPNLEIKTISHQQNNFSSTTLYPDLFSRIVRLSRSSTCWHLTTIVSSRDLVGASISSFLVRKNDFLSPEARQQCSQGPLQIYRLMRLALLCRESLSQSAIASPLQLIRGPVSTNLDQSSANFYGIIYSAIIQYLVQLYTQRRWGIGNLRVSHRLSRNIHEHRVRLTVGAGFFGVFEQYGNFLVATSFRRTVSSCALGSMISATLQSRAVLNQQVDAAKRSSRERKVQNQFEN